MANTYESMIALNPNLEKENLTALLDGFKEVIARRGGTIIAEKDLGKKKFAYTVKKFTTGFYQLFFFTAPPAVVTDLETSFKHSEDVLKFLTVRLDEKELKLTLAALESMAAPAAPAAAAPTAAAPAAATLVAVKEEEADGQLQ